MTSDNRDPRQVPEGDDIFRDRQNSQINQPDFSGEDEEGNLYLNENQAHAFEQVFAYMDEVLSQAERDVVHLNVTQIMVEASRGENANEALLWKRLDDLRRSHPHVLQRLLDSLNATGAWFPERVRRVAERMAEQINNPSPDQETF